MTSRSLVAAMLAATTMLIAAAPATAQKYYMRERIVGVPTTAIVYTPTYSSAYGACSNGSQTAPIATCKDPAGKTVANSLCGASAQTSPPRKCTSYVCGTFKPDAYLPGAVQIAMNVSTDAAAKTLCEAYAANNASAGACIRETANQQYLYFVKNGNPASVSYASYNNQNISFCAAQ